MTTIVLLRSLSTARPRTRPAVRSAISNRAPHALSPSGAAWLATTLIGVVSHTAHRVHAFVFSFCV